MSEINSTKEITSKFESFIVDLSLKELHVLNRVVVDQINLLQRASAFIAMSDLRIGERVSWTGNGEKLTGTIFRLNQKTVSVKVDNGEGYWKLSPQLLTKI